MAKTESQGLQIAVIIFAILVILLSVSTYYFFNEWSEAEKRETDANTKAAQADVATRKADQDLTQLAGLIGVSTDGTSQEMFKRAVEAWEADKTAFAGTLPEQQQNYRAALAMYHGELIKTNAEINDERDKLVAMEAMIQALENKWTERLNTVKTAFETDSQSFLRELADRKNKRAGDLQQVASLDGKIRDAQSKFTDMETKLQNDITGLKKQLQLAEAGGAKLKDKVNRLENQTFEVADGEIRFVSPSSRTVYINLGRADNLRPQVTFSVYGEDANVAGRIAQIDQGATEMNRKKHPCPAKRRDRSHSHLG